MILRANKNHSKDDIKAAMVRWNEANHALMKKRSELIVAAHLAGIGRRAIADSMGIGTSTVDRAIQAYRNRNSS